MFRYCIQVIRLGLIVQPSVLPVGLPGLVRQVGIAHTGIHPNGRVFTTVCMVLYFSVAIQPHVAGM